MELIEREQQLKKLTDAWSRVMRRRLHEQGVKNIPGATRLIKQDACGLIARELEFLRLIAKGLSNPAIAEKLMISVGLSRPISTVSWAQRTVFRLCPGRGNCTF